MSTFPSVAPETILAGDGQWLTTERVADMAAAPLNCVATAFPHYAYSVSGPEETIAPREQHPIFFGCFDWHSAVHNHWSLLRQLRLVPDHPRKADILHHCEERFTDENVAREVGYFQEHPTFERPYGWAWFLRLVSELTLWEDPRAERWYETLAPLEDRLTELIETRFLSQERPFRIGTHQNSAFGLLSVLDYARTTGQDGLATEAAETAEAWYLDDRDAPVAWEPFGYDFLSPTLTEMDLMRRVLGPDRFADWADVFLPDLTDASDDGFLEPMALETDPDEALAFHFIGLDLSKAWCFAGVAEALPDNATAERCRSAAVRHVGASFEQAFTEDYAGGHWLVSFALYLGTRNAGGIAD